MNNFWKGVKYLLGITSIVWGTIWFGYVLSVLWSWFIVTSFGLPVLKIPVMIGIALIIRFIVYNPTADFNDTRDNETKITHGILYSACYPAFILLFAWILTLFI